MELLPSKLLELLFISVTISTIVMVINQKIKALPFIKKDWHIWILNFIFAFLLGIPFAITFYNLSLCESIWVSIFSFIGAPALYDALKNQNLSSYKVKTNNDITVSKDNEIIRE